MRFEQLEGYQFDLPERLIARHPARQRGQDRLMVVRFPSGEIESTEFPHLERYLCPGTDQSFPGDCLVFNQTRVVPARVLLARESGARLPTLFLGPDFRSARQRALLPRQKRLRNGEILSLVTSRQVTEARPNIRFEVEKNISGEGNTEDRSLWLRALQTETNQAKGKRQYLETLPDDFFDIHGEMPLPPYLKRAATSEDHNRYQTVYARHAGSVASPTAGLHFTREHLDRLDKLGIRQAWLELRVGPGTFSPLKRENFQENRLHTESWEIPTGAADAIAKTRGAGGRIISVGTTSLRALEDAHRKGVLGQGGHGDSNLFLKPGDTIQAADGLLTNFHLPGSSLLLLVSALAGRDIILKAYQQAIREEYRFYSYGDAMLLLPD